MSSERRQVRVHCHRAERRVSFPTAQRGRLGARVRETVEPVELAREASIHAVLRHSCSLRINETQVVQERLAERKAICAWRTELVETFL